MYCDDGSFIIIFLVYEACNMKSGDITSVDSAASTGL